MAEKDKYTRKWIIESSIPILSRYEDRILTIRALHYQLVSIGMTNDQRHYHRVVSAMIEARWAGLVSFEKFCDNDRSMICETNSRITDLDDETKNSQRQICAWMSSYHKNRWENQIYYPEVLIEKKALQGVFQKPCEEHEVALGACKGYPSLTFLYELAGRLHQAIRRDKIPLILYFGDYDPSGEDIPRSIQENMTRFGIDVEVRRIALFDKQVKEWNLPPAPIKSGDSRSVNWDGIGQVELDAVRPEVLQQLCKDAIESVFDYETYLELLDQESEESVIYQNNLREFVKTL